MSYYFFYVFTSSLLLSLIFYVLPNAGVALAEIEVKPLVAVGPDCELRNMHDWHPQLCMSGDRANGSVELSCYANSLNFTRYDLREWVSRFTRGGGIFRSFRLFRCTLRTPECCIHTTRFSGLLISFSLF